MKYIQLISVFCILAAVHAHMGVSQSIVEAGSCVEFDLRISHDCGDDTVGTTNFTVELPMDPPIFSVKVHQVPIWRVFINKQKLDKPAKMGKYTFDEAVIDSFLMNSTRLTRSMERCLWSQRIRWCGSRDTKIATIKAKVIINDSLSKIGMSRKLCTIFTFHDSGAL